MRSSPLRIIACTCGDTVKSKTEIAAFSGGISSAVAPINVISTVTASIRLWLSHSTRTGNSGSPPSSISKISLGAEDPTHEHRDDDPQYDRDKQTLRRSNCISRIRVPDLKHRDEVQTGLQKRVGQPPGEIQIKEERQQRGNQD